jgi:hypothetical protein
MHTIKVVDFDGNQIFFDRYWSAVPKVGEIFENRSSKKSYQVCHIVHRFDTVNHVIELVCVELEYSFFEVLRATRNVR